MTNDVEEKTIGFIRASLRLDDDVEIKPETNIIMELDGDSLDVIEIVIDIEECFDIDILEEDLEKVMLVGDLLTLVENAVAAKH